MAYTTPVEKFIGILLLFFLFGMIFLWWNEPEAPITDEDMFKIFSNSGMQTFFEEHGIRNVEKISLFNLDVRGDRNNDDQRLLDGRLFQADFHTKNKGRYRCTLLCTINIDEEKLVEAEFKVADIKDKGKIVIHEKYTPQSTGKRQEVVSYITHYVFYYLRDKTNLLIGFKPKGEKII